MAQRSKAEFYSGPNSVPDTVKIEANEALLNPDKTEGRKLRRLLLDFVDTFFAIVDQLTSNTIRGLDQKVKNLTRRDAILAKYLVAGMRVAVTNNATAAQVGDGVDNGPAEYFLLRDSGGTVQAFVDAEPDTTAKVACRWVRSDGTYADQTGSYPLFDFYEVLAAGDVRRYNLNNAFMRLFQANKAMNGAAPTPPRTDPFNPAPTGEEDDEYWFPFSPLPPAVSYGAEIDLGAATHMGQAVQFGLLYAITDKWNGGESVQTVFVHGLTGGVFDNQGIVLAGGVPYRVQVNISAGTFAPLSMGIQDSLAPDSNVNAPSVRAVNEAFTSTNEAVVNAQASADDAQDSANTAFQGLAEKQDKEAGKGLSKNDFTDLLKTKLDGIQNLANVTNDAQVKRSELGVALGVPTTDINNKILDAFFPDWIVGGLKYQGTYLFGANKISSPTAALNNQPLPTAAAANAGWYFIVQDSGMTNGKIFDVGDWLISNGAAGWNKVDNTDAVISVAGRTGAVVLTTDDVAEPAVGATRLYLTDARVAGAKLIAYAKAAVYAGITAANSVGEAIGLLERRTDDLDTQINALATVGVQSGAVVDMAVRYQTRADWTGVWNTTTINNNTKLRTVEIAARSLNNTYVTTNSTGVNVRTGTVAITTGTSTITGVGTNFTSVFALGDKIRIDGATVFTIAQVVSATQLVTTTNAAATIAATAVYDRLQPDTITGWLIHDSSLTGATYPTTVNGAANTQILVYQRGGIFIPGRINIFEVQAWQITGGFVFYVYISQSPLN